MTLGVSRAASSPELTLFRTPGQGSELKAAILSPATVYTARVNQSFSTFDGILEITYDGGTGTLSDVKADMTLLIGSSAGAHDIGICRVRSIDGTKVYIGETSDVRFANDQYLTVLRDWSLWAKHVLLSSGVPYMDGGIAYSDQHAAPDPTPIMGGNRVLKLEGATVSTQFDFSASYVIGGLSSISGYSTSAPTADSVTGPTTSTPTVVIDAVGWHPVYLTLTAANGKTFMSVRWVYVWNDDNPPTSASFTENPRCEAETGGWQFGLTLYNNVNLTDVRDRTLVLLFAEDYYGNTKQSIGQVAGCENVCVEGWIAGETIEWNPEAGQVSFTAYTAQYWFGKIPAFPDGVELVARAPAAWTEFQNLTVDKGLWHFLHWRTTATRVMDVFLTGDTKYTKEVSSLASNLWEQIREMGFLQIFARPGVNAHNQLFIQVHPQLVPLASRTWATVMTITKPDWEGEINFDRITVTPNSYVNLSGVAVNSAGEGIPYFSLSPGHAYPHYGDPELLDNLLAESQAQSNSLAGLYRGWLNNPFPNIPITLSANNRLIDCFPRQQCAIVIDAADTPRGIAYDGNLIPAAVELVHDPNTGYLHTEVTFEAETFEDISINGDVPGGSGSGTIPVPPGISFPPLPDFTPIFSGDPSAVPDGPPTVILVTDSGLLYTRNFNTSSPKPDYVFWNSGIASADVPYISLSQASGRIQVFITPNGSVWVGVYEKSFNRWMDTIYYAPALGTPFQKIIDQTWLNANEPGGDEGITGLGVNPTKPEEVIFIAGDESSFGTSHHLWIGNHSGFVQKTAVSMLGQFATPLTYGAGEWGHITSNNGGGTKTFRRFAGDGSSVLSAVNISNISGSGATPMHWRAGTSLVIIAYNGDGDLIARSEDGGATFADIDINKEFFRQFALHPGGQYMLAGWDGAAGQRGKSSDGGSTWSGLPNLPFGGEYCFAYAGGAGVNSRWIAARGVIRYSNNAFGAESWLNKEGNINLLIPAGLLIRKVIVPGYY